MFSCLNIHNQIVNIEDYLINSKLTGFYPDIFCPFCNKKLFVKAKNSIERAHFSHYPKQSCSYKSYDELFISSGIPKSPKEIEELKKSIIKCSYNIFFKLKSEYINTLDSQLFLKILKRISNPQILKLRNLKCEHIAYIWLNELERFNNKVYLYTNSSKINLNTIKFNTPILWNTSEKKDIIITVEELENDVISRSITPIDLNFLHSNITFTTEFLIKIVPQIFDIFSLSTKQSENLLKELLCLMQ